MRFDFLFMVSVQRICIEDERIKTVKTWPEPQSVRYIQVLIDFTYVYHRLIKSFSKIAALLSLILKITTPTISKFRKAKGRNNDDNQGSGVLVELFMMVEKLKICQRSQSSKID